MMFIICDSIPYILSETLCLPLHLITFCLFSPIVLKTMNSTNEMIDDDMIDIDELRKHFYITVNGRIVNDWTSAVKNGDNFHVHLRILGGKGGLSFDHFEIYLE